MASKRWRRIVEEAGSSPSPYRAFMVNRAGTIITVRESEVIWQEQQGYLVFARESDIMTPSLTDIQSHPFRYLDTTRDDE